MQVRALSSLSYHHHHQKNNHHKNTKSQKNKKKASNAGKHPPNLIGHDTIIIFVTYIYMLSFSYSYVIIFIVSKGYLQQSILIQQELANRLGLCRGRACRSIIIDILQARHMLYSGYIDVGYTAKNMWQYSQWLYCHVYLAIQPIIHGNIFPTVSTLSTMSKFSKFSKFSTFQTLP